MNEMKVEKKSLKIRKLALTRETLRHLSSEQLQEVAGGAWTQWCSFIVCITTF
jgi:hypothetical protein